MFTHVFYVGCHMLLALSPRFFTAMSMYSFANFSSCSNSSITLSHNFVDFSSISILFNLYSFGVGPKENRIGSVYPISFLLLLLLFRICEFLLHNFLNPFLF